MEIKEKEKRNLDNLLKLVSMINAMDKKASSYFEDHDKFKFIASEQYSQLIWQYIRFNSKYKKDYFNRNNLARKYYLSNWCLSRPVDPNEFFLNEEKIFFKYAHISSTEIDIKNSGYDYRDKEPLSITLTIHPMARPDFVWDFLKKYIALYHPIFLNPGIRYRLEPKNIGYYANYFAYFFLHKKLKFGLKDIRDLIRDPKYKNILRVSESGLKQRTLDNSVEKFEKIQSFSPFCFFQGSSKIV